MAKKDTKKQAPEQAPEEEKETAKAEAEANDAKPENEEPSELEKLREQLSQTNERLLRTLAEYDNYRKRSQKEKEQAYNDSKASALAELLPVLDNFDRAAGNKDASFEDYKKGIDMIFNQFNEIIKKLGVETFGEKGEAFDPNIHNAVMHIDDENEEESVITDVFSKGYKLGDRILRPAAVKVAN